MLWHMTCCDIFLHDIWHRKSWHPQCKEVLIAINVLSCFQLSSTSHDHAKNAIMNERSNRKQLPNTTIKDTDLVTPSMLQNNWQIKLRKASDEEPYCLSVHTFPVHDDGILWYGHRHSCSCWVWEDWIMWCE